MDADLALAAAYAAGGQPPPAAFAPQHQQQQQQSPAPRRQQAGAGEEEYVMEGELPSIDDLEVAAAAAGVAPVPAVLAEMGYFELGLQPAAAAEVPQDSLSDDSGDEAESSSDEGGRTTPVLAAAVPGCLGCTHLPAFSTQPRPAPALCCCADGWVRFRRPAAWPSDPDASHESAAGIVRLLLRPLGGGQDGVSVRLLLVGGGPRGTAAAAGMEVEEVADDSGFSSSASSGSSSDDEASSASADEPLDVIQNYSELRQMIDDMDADVDADEDGGGGAAAAHRAERELLGSLPLPALAGVQVSADEAVQAAGIVLSMLEGMVVVKASWRPADLAVAPGSSDTRQGGSGGGRGVDAACPALWGAPMPAVQAGSAAAASCLLQAQAGSRALNEGCVLVLEDRSPIGCVEEIFGPGAAGVAWHCQWRCRAGRACRLGRLHSLPLQRAALLLPRLVWQRQHLRSPWCVCSSIWLGLLPAIDCLRAPACLPALPATVQS